MDDNKSLAWFFLGLGVGVAVGMIFAPQAGAETRTLIRTRAEEGGEYIKRRGSELREGATGLVDRGKQAVSRGREQLGAAVEAGRQTYREAIGGAAPEGGAAPSATPTEGV